MKDLLWPPRIRPANRGGAKSGSARLVRAFLSAPGGMMALIVVAALAATAALAPPILGLQSANLDLNIATQGPSKLHLLGTDTLGRDILGRTLVAARLSLTLAVLATAVAASAGVVIGAGIALSGPRLRVIGARLIDTLLGFPSILVGIFVTTIVGPSAKAAVLGIGVAFAPQFARIVSNLASSVAGQDYVASARVLGLSLPTVLRRHVLPNIAETIILVTFVSIGDSIIAVSSLSFLGLGVQPPEYDWGQMLTQGVQTFYLTPTAALSPAFMISLAGLSAGLFGDAAARAFNPLLWTDSKASRAPVADADSRRLRDSAANQDLTGDTAASQRVLLQVHGLSVSFATASGSVKPVVDVSFEIHQSEIVGLVGESGSGKTLAALAIAQLIPWPGRVRARSLIFQGHGLLSEDRRKVDEVLSTQLAFVFQDPMSSFNPALRIGAQLVEASRAHRHLSRSTAKQEAVGRMGEVGIAAPERRLRQYPHEFSGGMRQRAMIAMALMVKPALIIADEPTTSLDVTVQAQIMDLLRRINVDHGTAILLISHDLALVAQECDRVVVMYGGRTVEDVPTASLRNSAHPYTRALIESLPSLTANRGKHLVSIPGAPPDPASMPPGCPFAPRCPLVVDKCAHMPPMESRTGGHRVACWRSAEVASQPIL